MTDPRAILEAYAAERDVGFHDYEFAREEGEPRAFAALRAVLAIHQVAPGYSWCMHCSGGEYTEPWPCPTVRAITTALEAP